MNRAKMVIAFAVAIGALWGAAVPASANFHAKSYPAQIKGEKIKDPQLVDGEDATACQLGKYEGILLADSEQYEIGGQIWRMQRHCQGRRTESGENRI